MEDYITLNCSWFPLTVLQFMLPLRIANKASCSLQSHTVNFKNSATGLGRRENFLGFLFLIWSMVGWICGYGREELLYVDLNLEDIQKHSETWDKVWQPPPRTYCCWCGMSQFLNKRTLGGKSQNEIDVLEYKPSDKILYLEFETKAFCYLTAWT